MWLVVRVVALAVVIAGALVLAGEGDRLLALVDRAVGLFGTGPVMPHDGGELPWPMRVGGLALGLAAAFAHPVGRAVRQLVTLLHELGHTLVAAALGARPAGIVLRHDASGHARARWVGRAGLMRRLALAAVAFAGLPAAATVSAIGARLFDLVGPDAVLWLFAIAGLVVTLLARSPWSLLVAVGTGGLAVAAMTEAAEAWAAGIVVAVLAAIAVRTTHDNWRALGHPLQRGDDARAVAGHLRLPARMVQLVQFVLGAGLSVWAVWLLLAPLPGLT
ncbi:hypothetical protein ER308_01680 [Egibacter rhizosphaerae]|uniref:M50 family peptidase n=1 Tax=Egibacter rhizosphaerae TaxID=1670831 RepID=A0A411YB38_9ACTN|nr:M50 family metallopeptidase [Egibacter rhizosphaerae]QBI18406.1 hypothetical protein ER308_01680 [Egibacter rhizosphaerae]